MSVYVIGVDPGSTTGVCILSRGSVIDAWQEDKDVSHYRMVKWVTANRDTIKRIAIEDQFMMKPRAPTPGDSSWGTSPHAVIEVSRSAGETIGWLKCAGYPPSQLVDVLPQTWRSKIGIKGKGRDEKEAQARLYASKVFGQLPKSQTHMAEAYCIAQWCWNEMAFNLESPINRIMPR
jgi:hypothetical protein